MVMPSAQESISPTFTMRLVETSNQIKANFVYMTWVFRYLQYSSSILTDVAYYTCPEIDDIFYFQPSHLIIRLIQNS